MALHAIVDAEPAGSAFNQFLQNLYALRTLDDFAVFVMGEAPRFVASDLTSYTELNPLLRRAFATFSSADGQRVYDKHHPKFWKFMHQHPLVQHYQQQPDGGPKKITDFMPVETWRQTNLYTEFYRFFDLSYQMVATLPANAQSMVGIAFNRRDRDFDEHDRAVLTQLHPHLTQAFRNVLSRAGALRKLQSTERALEMLGGGVILLADDLTPTSMSDLAHQSLRDFFPNHDAKTDGLPQALRIWLARGGTEPMVMERASGRLTLSVEKDDGVPDHIILKRETYADSADSLQPLGLTKREAEVLYWVAQGKSNAEIAIIHGASIRTVKKQVETILKKLRVNNRTSAAVKAIEKLGRARQQGT